MLNDVTSCCITMGEFKVHHPIISIDRCSRPHPSRALNQYFIHLHPLFLSWAFTPTPALRDAKILYTLLIMFSSPDSTSIWKFLYVLSILLILFTAEVIPGFLSIITSPKRRQFYNKYFHFGYIVKAKTANMKPLNVLPSGLREKLHPL